MSLLASHSASSCFCLLDRTIGGKTGNQRDIEVSRNGHGPQCGTQIGQWIGRVDSIQRSNSSVITSRPCALRRDILSMMSRHRDLNDGSAVRL